MKTMQEVADFFRKNKKGILKVSIDSKDLKFFTVNSRGRIVDSGEVLLSEDGNVIPKENNTLYATTVELPTIEVGRFPVISFSKESKRTELNYKITQIEQK